MHSESDVSATRLSHCGANYKESLTSADAPDSIERAPQVIGSLHVSHRKHSRLKLAVTCKRCSVQLTMSNTSGTKRLHVNEK